MDTTSNLYVHVLVEMLDKDQATSGAARAGVILLLCFGFLSGRVRTLDRVGVEKAISSAVFLGTGKGTEIWSMLSKRSQTPTKSETG